MVRGPRKHLKRVAAPHHWMLAKLGGVFAPRPTNGPHSLRECLPLAVLLRNRLKYALTYKEVKMIAKKRIVKIDGKTRTDVKFPVGVMDVISLDKSNENFRLLLDTKGRFKAHKIRKEEAEFKLCRVQKIRVGERKVPYAVTNDGRTVRFIHPDVKANDTIRLNLKTGKVLDWIKFTEGSLVMITGGKNIGRIGKITKREQHMGSFEIIHVEDIKGNQFATRLQNCFTIGSSPDIGKAFITLPKGNGVRKTQMQDRNERLNVNAKK
eukprot:Selendium_serpulae@DN3779_c0_g1_i1.p1